MYADPFTLLAVVDLQTRNCTMSFYKKKQLWFWIYKHLFIYLFIRYLFGNFFGFLLMPMWTLRLLVEKVQYCLVGAISGEAKVNNWKSVSDLSSWWCQIDVVSFRCGVWISARVPVSWYEVIGLDFWLSCCPCCWCRQTQEPSSELVGLRTVSSHWKWKCALSALIKMSKLLRCVSWISTILFIFFGFSPWLLWF